MKYNIPIYQLNVTWGFESSATHSIVELTLSAIFTVDASFLILGVIRTNLGGIRTVKNAISDLIAFDFSLAVTWQWYCKLSLIVAFFMTKLCSPRSNFI